MELIRFGLKHPYFASSLGVGLFSAVDFALNRAPTDEIALQWSVPLGLTVFAVMYVLEKSAIHLLRLGFAVKVRHMPEDDIACTEHAKRVLDEARALGIQATPWEIWDLREENREKDSSHTVVELQWGKTTAVVNREDAGLHGRVTVSKLNRLKRQNIATRNEEIQ